MPINISVPDLAELKPRITVFGVGGGGCNAVNNMINSNLSGVEFVVANTDAQALANSPCQRKIQMGVSITQGLGAGSQPEVGAAAAEETKDEIVDHLADSHMVFVTAGMGGGTGTGAAPVIASLAREQGILTVGVVTKPFDFEGRRRMAIAERGIDTLAQHVDTLIVIPNQNLFRVANEATSFTAAFQMADQVLFSGVASITELMTKEGLINLDFADVRAVMSDMGKAMMGTGEASGEKRAEEAALAAISNPLLDIDSMAGARGVLISIAGGPDLTLYEVDQAASRIREEVDPEANIIVGATIEEDLEGTMRVSVVATGLAQEAHAAGNTRQTGTRQTDTRQAAPMPGGLSGMSAPGIAGLPGAALGGVHGGGISGADNGGEEARAAADDMARADESSATRQQENEPESAGEAPMMRGSSMAEPEGDLELPLDMAEPEMSQPKDDIATEAPGMRQGGHEERDVLDAAMPQPPSAQPQARIAPGGGMDAGAERQVRDSRIPDVDDLPASMRNLVKSKQDRIRNLGNAPRPPAQPGRQRKRDRILGKVKELFGRGHDAPQAGKPRAESDDAASRQPQARPQPRVVNGGPQPMTLDSVHAERNDASPLADDDGLNIPAFLRRK